MGFSVVIARSRKRRGNPEAAREGLDCLACVTHDGEGAGKRKPRRLVIALRGVPLAGS